MNTENFFESQKTQSEIKSKLVSRYFWFWAKVIPGYMKMYNKEKMVYLDLYSGPGKFEDGKPSTPILVMESAIRDDVISNHLQPIFNDQEKKYIDLLRSEVMQLNGIERIKHQPVFLNREVETMKAEEIFPDFPKKVPPTLLFADPFGYKGLSPSLLSIVRFWGCDVIFFFNFHQINRALVNPVMSKNMDILFGKEYALELRSEIKQRSEELNSVERELLVLDGMEKSLRDMSPKLQPMLKFKFLDPKANKANHYVVFLTTNKFAFAKMKEIMSGISREEGAAIGSFKFDPKKISPPKGQMTLLFPENELEDLKLHLTNSFAGKSLTVKDLFYQDQHLNTKFTEQNYKDALRELEFEAKINISPPISERRSFKGKISMPDNAIVTFK